jgi:hypothetical protein
MSSGAISRLLTVVLIPIAVLLNSVEQNFLERTSY